MPESRKIVVKTSKRGSSPGERRGGRKKGVPNKATADIRELARQYSPAAMQELARLSVEAESEAARVGAIKEILDRAYGKSTAIISGDQENPVRHVMRVELAPLVADADGED